MFRLENQDVKLTSVNPRAELHGDETKMACDLQFEFTTGNDVLNLFDACLKPALYEKPKNHPQEELIEDDNYLPSLRFPEFGALPWGYKGAGYRAVINYGFTGEEDIHLIQTELDKFKFELKEGGSVTTKFRVIAHPTAKELGTLCEAIQQHVTLTLEPPSPEEAAQMELDEAYKDSGIPEENQYSVTVSAEEFEESFNDALEETSVED